MFSLIKIILIIISVLTSNKVLLKSDKPDLNKPEIKIELDPDDPDPNSGGISICAAIVLQLTFYVLVHYINYRFCPKDKDDTHKEEEQDINNIDN